MTGLWGHRRGAVSVFAAVVLPVLIGVTAFTIDAGLWYLQRRTLQNAADMAAMAAARNPAAGTALATEAAALNGADPSWITSVSPGYYCARAALPQESRFRAAPFSAAECGTAITAPNAVRVAMETESPVFFGRIFLKAAGQKTRIGVASVAASIDAAGLRAGSGVAALDAGIANAMLSSLAGGNVSLTAVQYDALLNSDLDALGYFDALATRIGVTAGSYRALLDSEVAVSTLLDVAAGVLSRPGSTATAAIAANGLSLLAGQIAGTPRLKIGKLFSISDGADGTIGNPAALKAQINAYQLATLTLQTANRNNVIAIPTASAGIPNLAELKLEASAIEPMQQPPFAFGPAGTSVHTAQVRLKMRLQVLGLGGLTALLNLKVLDVPLYIEVGHGDAMLRSITCAGNATRMTVDATSGIAALHIGTVPADAMTNFSKPVRAADVGNAQILNVAGLITVSARGSAEVGSGAGQPTALVFRKPGQTITPPTEAYFTTPDQPGGLARATSQGMAGNLFTTLANSLEVNGSLLFITLGLKAGILGLLKPVVTGLDPIVDALLRSLGIRLGYLDVGVTGVRCGVPALVG